MVTWRRCRGAGSASWDGEQPARVGGRSAQFAELEAADSSVGPYRFFSTPCGRSSGRRLELEDLRRPVLERAEAAIEPSYHVADERGQHRCLATAISAAVISRIWVTRRACVDARGGDGCTGDINEARADGSTC
jgi:hypothetical protein